VKVKWFDSIVIKSSAAVVLLVAVSIVIFAFQIMKEEAQHTEAELLKTGTFLADTLARQSVLPLLQQDGAALQNLVDAFDADTERVDIGSFVTYALILDRNGTLLAGAGNQEAAGLIGDASSSTRGGGDGRAAHRLDPEHLEFHTSITHEGDAIGRVRLGITQRHRYELLDAVKARTLRTMGGLSLAAMLAGVLFSRRLVRPLKHLADSARKIGERQWGQKVRVTGSDEIAQLASTFNEMSANLRRAFEESRQASQRLIQADKFAALGTLSATLAHELKNPLTAIKMIMEAAVDQEQVDCTRQDLDVMLHEVRRMESTVDETLGLAGPPEVDLGLHDLNQVIRDILALTRHRLEISGIRTTLALDENVPVFFFDAKHMEQVLLNLIVNAVEAMPHGGEFEIRTAWDTAAGQIRIEIRDEGSGIPEDIRSRIFDPFFTTKEQGTGVGLSIVYTMVREHGGEVELESAEGAGTTFVITLPVKGESRNAPHPDRG
jgi:signal transduction histidine kinase